ELVVACRVDEIAHALLEARDCTRAGRGQVCGNREKRSAACRGHERVAFERSVVDLVGVEEHEPINGDVILGFELGAIRLFALRIPTVEVAAVTHGRRDVTSRDHGRQVLEVRRYASRTPSLGGASTVGETTTAQRCKDGGYELWTRFFASTARVSLPW